MAPQTPLDDADIQRLDELLAAVPAPLEALDSSALDGFLCGVLLQPQPVAAARWLPHVTDLDSRAAPPDYPLAELHALVLRRHAELAGCIAQRQWFDPWIFELDEAGPPAEALLPWVAGFAAAMDLFPALMNTSHPGLLEPLALIYRHFDPDDLEDADELLAEIDTLEPPVDLDEAVQDLVRSLMLLADVTRPRAPSGGPRGTPRRGPRRR